MVVLLPHLQCFTHSIRSLFHKCSSNGTCKPCDYLQLCIQTIFIKIEQNEHFSLGSWALLKLPVCCAFNVYSRSVRFASVFWRISLTVWQHGPITMYANPSYIYIIKLLKFIMIVINRLIVPPEIEAGSSSTSLQVRVHIHATAANSR